jgi:PAS domain S-box-containing protein
MGPLLDITSRKQALDALEESEEKYRQLFESESDAVMIFDAETQQFEDANPATLDLFGYSKEEFLSLQVEDISAEKDKTRLSVEKVRNAATYNMKIPQRYFSRKDGSTFPGEISAGKFFSGDRQKIIGAVRDITERVQAEDKIRGLSQEQIKVQENERNRIARYLHDHVAQDLSTLKIGLETLFNEPKKLSPEKKKKISEFSQVLQDSISSVRDLSYDLRPAGMDQLGLVRTVYQLCEDFSEKNNLNVDFYSAGVKDLKLDFDTAINLYRLIQEGLNNINKHARADNVIIRLVASSPNIILRIEDDGQGFDVNNRLSKALKEKRMGLSNMEERVSLLAGKMDIRSQIARGTRIFIEIPWPEKKNGR